MELISFREAHLVLCFIFVTKRVLITHQCFSYGWAVLTQCQGCRFLCQWTGWGGQLEGTQPGHWTPPDQRDVPHHHAQQGHCGIVLPNQGLYEDWLGISLLVGGSEWLPLHHLFHTHMVIFITAFISTHEVFLAFALLILLSITLLVVWLLICWLESTHHGLKLLASVIKFTSHSFSHWAALLNSANSNESYKWS